MHLNKPNYSDLEFRDMKNKLFLKVTTRKKYHKCEKNSSKKDFDQVARMHSYCEYPLETK
jgi:hypothetical protein